MLFFFTIVILIYQPIPHDCSTINIITPLIHGIAGVSLYGVYGTSLSFLYDSHMVRGSISVPIEKDQGSGCWRISSTFPFSLALEPCDSVIAQGELRHLAALDQSCLIPTPAGKAGTPRHMAVKSIPRPELLASFISKLGKCHRYDLTVASKQTGKQSAVGIIPQDMRDILWISIGTPTMQGCLLAGKLQGIFFTVAPVVSECPRYVSVAVIIPLQGQLQLVHILWAGASGFLQAVRIILDSYLYGVVRILNGIGTVCSPFFFLYTTYPKT